MSHFEYTAQSKSGGAMSGTIESADAAAAVQELSSLGLSNVEVRPADRAARRQPLGRDDFIFFNEQLAALSGAGVCLDLGLRQLGQDVRAGRLRNAIEAIAGDIERGHTLEEAIEGHASQMPALYARVVRAGVRSGQLPATLLNLSQHLRLVAETRRLIAEAITYPAIVLALALGIFSAVLLFITPQFVEIFRDFDIQLPTLTLWMIGLSQVLLQLLIGAGTLILGLFLVLFILGRTRAGLLWREHLVFRIPCIGSLIRHSLQARFMRAMAFAIDASVPLPEALRLAAEATGSPSLEREAELIASRIEQGSKLEEACAKSGLIPAILGYFVGVKADSASLRDGLIHLSKASEARAAHAQAMLRGWIAPLAVVSVGVLIGLLILALFMPLVSLVQSVSGSC